MSDTPETDYNCGFHDLESAVPADFARKLERQRNELLAALTAILPFCEEDEQIMGLCDDYQAAIDQARSAISKAKEVA